MTMRLFKRVLSYFRPEWRPGLFAGLLLGLSTAANVLKPWPLAWILDGVLGRHPLPEGLAALRQWGGDAGLLAVLALSIFLLHAAAAGLTAWQNYLTISMGLRGLLRVR